MEAELCHLEYCYNTIKIPIFLDSEPGSGSLLWKYYEINTVLLSPSKTREIEKDIQTVSYVF